MQKTVEAVAQPVLNERWWWRWRWVLLLLLLVLFWLSSELFPDLPLREGTVALYRVLAGGVAVFLIGIWAVRSAYRKTKHSSNKIGCIFSLLGWVLAIKIFSIGGFVLFAMASNLSAGKASVRTIEYSIEGHEIVIGCSGKGFDVNQSTLEKLEAEQPSALEVTYWQPNIVESVQFLSQAEAGQIIMPCH
ncbi:hypothetical protein KRX19_06125 [Cardiobacteriaceae bacterium TAE3-ERU3]|nr:hypothetical protein [Cardiobacteriaceae bacterium TAE3-ERU3]